MIAIRSFISPYWVSVGQNVNNRPIVLEKPILRPYLIGRYCAHEDLVRIFKLDEIDWILAGMTDVADGELNLEKGLPGNTLAGTVFDSKYEVLGEIARGGMGIVYRGTDQSLGRSVAIKVLLRQFNSDSESVARFRREARAMAALDHPNVVPVYAIGHELELHYFVMKFLAG